MISYQGKLTTASGGCLNDTVQMTFTIYSDSLGTSSEWAETQPEVIVKEGVFSILLGSVDSIPASVFDGSIKYLGVQVESDPEMRPLKPMVSVAYAYKSLEADTANYAHAGAGGVDDDWAFRVTDTADTTLITRGPWGISRYGNALHGNADSTHVNLGAACTTGTSGQNHKYCTIGGGFRNTAGGAATVGGGRDNIASGGASTVAGGISNIASGVVATVGGGESNTASGGEFATVGGGWQNTASGNKSTVGGGEQNTAGISGYTTVGGGYHNRASETSATVGGGWWNTASNTAGTVAGGVGNTASGMYATVPGGYIDTAAGDYSLAAGREVTTSSDADYTFAFGRDFTTSTPNAVIFHNTVDPIKVGIGTTNPQYMLDIRGTTGIDVGTNFSDVPLTINVPSDQSALISRIAKGGSIINVVDADGNVGIGTFSPQEKLDVAGTAQVTGFIMPTDASNGYVLTSDGSGVGTWQPGGGGPNSGWVDDGTVVRLQTSSDSVGIGTTSPGAPLQVGSGSHAPVFLNTDVQIDHDDASSHRMEIRNNNGATGWAIDASGTTTFGPISATKNLYLLGGNSVRMTIDGSSGDIGIGTTSPNHTLDVNGDINVSGSYNVKKGGVNYNHPDYVFEPDYNLMSLEQLKSYVRKNKSLPNVITAEDVKKNEGFKMDELLIQMLEKIEEQTLYIFQLEERIAELEKNSQNQ